MQGAKNKTMSHKLIIKRDKYIISIFANRVSEMFVDAGEIEYECTIRYNSPRHTSYNWIVHPIVGSETSKNKNVIKEFIKNNTI